MLKRPSRLIPSGRCSRPWAAFIPATRLVGLGFLATLLSAPVAAQSADHGYVGGSVGPFAVSADIADGWIPGAGIVAGVAIRPRWDVETDVFLLRGRVTNDYGTADGPPSYSRAPAGASAEDIARFGTWLRYENRREHTATVSVAAIYHRPLERIPRLELGFIGGVSVQRVTDTRVRTPIRFGSAIVPTPRDMRIESETYGRSIGGPLLGVQASYALAPGLRVQPDVRYHYGSIGDQINNGSQITVRTIWRL